MTHLQLLLVYYGVVEDHNLVWLCCPLVSESKYFINIRGK